MSEVEKALYNYLFPMKITYATDSVSCCEKIAVVVAEEKDDAIFEEIIKIAKESGINDLTILNKRYIIQAIQEKQQREQTLQFCHAGQAIID